MIPSIHRPSKITIDLEAIRSNISNELARLDEDQVMFAVIKANAYGHGSVEVAETAIKAGVSGFCVSNLDEALELRQAGIQLPILVLSYITPNYVPLAVKHDISLTAPSLEWIESVLSGYEETTPVKVHVKIDSGMGRIGLRTEEDMIKANQLLSNQSVIRFEGLFTHFATADSTSVDYFKRQQDRFTKALSIFPADLPYIHAANSATALWHDAWKSTMVRFGTAMYGLNPSGTDIAPPYELKPVLQLESELIHVKQVVKGEKIGYGATYEADCDEWIGTIPMGYADGFRRSFKDYEVIIDGQRMPLVGRICMDQCMVRLPKEYAVGTKVTFFGENKGCINTIQAAAEYIDTINYEVTCCLSDRLPRLFLNE